ncbi:zeta toxin family protein [Streptomyces sp. NPDC006655]|uniref:zeta toxin family protein n=1 Tax=Streptomyces sp. NPDC006655 TaxID=3156898 RepID=UPI00345464E0
MTGSGPAGLPSAAPAGDWSEKVLTGTVLPSVLGGAVFQPEVRPVVVFVLAQPGIGKTLIVDLVHAALMRRGGAVRVDCDAYKNVHPRYAAFLAEDVCCPALKMPTEAAFTVPTSCDGDAPPVGVPAGRLSARCRFRR